MADPKLTIVIEQKGADGVVKSLKTIQKEGDTTVTRITKGNQLISESIRKVEGQTRSWSGALTAINTGYLASAQAIGQATRTLGGWIEAAREEGRSIQRRRVALQDASDAQVQALEDQAQAYLNLYGVADDVTRQAQAQASLMGVQTDNIDEVTRAALGLTEVYGGDLPENIEKVSRFALGLTNSIKGTSIAAKDNATFLQRLGIAAKETEGGIKILDDRMNTDEGQLERTTAKYDELKESLGTKLLPVVTDLAEQGEKMLDWYNGLDPTAQNIVAWSSAALVALGPVSTVLLNIANAIKLLGGGSAIAGGSAAVGGAAGLLTWLWPTTTGMDPGETSPGVYAPNSLPYQGNTEWGTKLLNYLRGNTTSDQKLKRPGDDRKRKGAAPFVDKKAIPDAFGLTGYYYDLLDKARYPGSEFGMGDYPTSPGFSFSRAMRDRVARLQHHVYGAANTHPYDFGIFAGAGPLGESWAGPGAPAWGPNLYSPTRRGFPEWWKSHGSDYVQAASGFANGGMGGGISALAGIAGNTLLPGAGGLIGGLVGKLFGGLFGGHKKRQGETPAQPIYTSDMNLQRLVNDLLNVTKMSIVRGASGGIDAGVKMLNAQNARAGV